MPVKEDAYPLVAARYEGKDFLTVADAIQRAKASQEGIEAARHKAREVDRARNREAIVAEVSRLLAAGAEKKKTERMAVAAAAKFGLSKADVRQMLRNPPPSSPIQDHPADLDAQEDDPIGAALHSLGFSRDCWIPLNVARKWRGVLCPRENSPEAFAQWAAFAERTSARFTDPSISWPVNRVAAMNEMMDDWEHDLALNQAKPPLGGGDIS